MRSRPAGPVARAARGPCAGLLPSILLCCCLPGRPLQLLCPLEYEPPKWHVPWWLMPWLPSGAIFLLVFTVGSVDDRCGAAPRQRGPAAAAAGSCSGPCPARRTALNPAALRHQLARRLLLATVLAGLDCPAAQHAKAGRSGRARRGALAPHAPPARAGRASGSLLPGWWAWCSSTSSSPCP